MLMVMTVEEQTGQDEPGVLGAAPSERPERSVRTLIARTVTGAWRDNIFSESAAAAFWQVLSLPPLLLGLLGSLGYIGSWFGAGAAEAVQDWLVNLAGSVFSQSAVQEIIRPTVSDILTTARSELVSIGFVISLWSGSSAISSFVDAISRAHGQYEVRNPVWQRILALLFYVAGLILVIVTSPLLALGPARLVSLLPTSWQPLANTLTDWFYLPGIGLLIMLGLTTLYKFALPNRLPWYRGLPGALVAAIVFLVGATGLRLYIDWLTGTGYTYGALGAPIAFLLATFFIGLAIILGAHFNAAIEQLWPSRRAQRAAATVPADAPADLRDVCPPPQLVAAIGRNPELAARTLERLNYGITRPGATSGVVGR
jgi:membrane protein